LKDTPVIARQAGYMPARAVINYIVYWRKEDSEKEIRIILPELYVRKPGR
jgi:ATP-dependent DNA helicase RecQ